MTRWVRRCALVASLSGLLAAQQPKLTLPVGEVVFGATFELLLELPAATPLDTALLRPLVVEPFDVEEVVVAQQAVRRHRCRARCYALGEVAIAGVPGAVLRVGSCLPTPPGELEWPDPWSLPRPLGWWPWLVAAVALLGGGWAFARRGRAIAAVVDEPAAPTSVAAAEDLAAALRRLTLPGDGERGEAFHMAVKALLRRHCIRRFEVPAEVRTSEELLRQVPDPAGHLARCLGTCDAALFAAHRPTAAAHAAARDAALQFVGQEGGGR